MKNIPSFLRTIFRPLQFLVLAAVSGVTARAQTVVITGNYVNGGTFYLGAHSGSPAGLMLTYDDSASDAVTQHANRVAGWLWENFDGTSTLPAMRLDQSNNLLLYNLGSEGVKLNPVAKSLTLGGSSGAVLTASGTALSTNGAFTVAGALTNTNGTLNGGASGLTLNAGGTNQNITLSSSAAGDIVFNTNGVERARINSAGNFGIGTSAPGLALDVIGTHVAATGVARFTGNATAGYISADTAVASNASSGFLAKVGGSLIGQFAAESSTNTVFITNRVSGTAPSIVIPSSGNVGFGTSSPTYRMDVRTPGATASQFHLASTDSDSGGFLVSAGADNSFLSGGIAYNGSAWIAKSPTYGILGAGGGYLSFFSGAGATVGSAVSLSTRMVIDPSGNVGIGTASPGMKLDVSGNLLLSGGRSVIFTTGDNTTTHRGGVQFLTMDNGVTNIWTPTDQTGAPVNSTIRLGGFNSFNTNVVNLSVTGNVGVGTQSPSSQLHVYGSAGTVAPVVGGGALYLQDTGGGANSGGAMLFGAFQGYYAGIKGLMTMGASNTIGDLAFFTRNAIGDAALAERMRLTQNGNVGIGTNNPTQKLSVAGTIRAYEVIVDTGWSDYVFDDDYHLAPLSEVEQQIKADKHLPGIPSAQEVAAHGVSMGDMQSKLLAKVEELTLHLIQQEKEIAALRQQVGQLQAAATK